MIMTRRYNYRNSAPSRKEEAYTKALAKLRALQEDCERPENRYLCPCISAADVKKDADRMRREYIRYKAHLYPDGPDSPPAPVDPKNVTPNEIFFRMLAQAGAELSDFDTLGNKDHEITDGYVRWNPPAALPKSRTGWDNLTKRVGREIARLEDRRKNGFGSTATPCDVCYAKTPEDKIPVGGILGATSYVCEMARAQTPEQIARLDP